MQNVVILFGIEGHVQSNWLIAHGPQPYWLHEPQPYWLHMAPNPTDCTRPPILLIAHGPQPYYGPQSYYGPQPYWLHMAPNY